MVRFQISTVHLLIIAVHASNFQVSAILGACVADAAARPLHWVYDMSDLKKFLNQKVGSTPEEKAVDRNKFPEFYPESKSPYYTVSD